MQGGKNPYINLGRYQNITLNEYFNEQIQ